MTQAFFTGIEKVILANLTKAKSSVRVAVAWCTNPKIFAVLEQLAEEGMAVQLVIADDRINFTAAKAYFESLLKRNVEIRITRHPHLMHHKFCLRDENLLITGSYNWTIGAEVNNYENVIVTNERPLINSFQEEFAALLKVSIRLKKILAADFSDYGSSIEHQEYNLVLDSGVDSFEQNLDDAEENELSEEAEESLDEADLLYLEGKLEEAIEICQRVLKSYPNAADAFEILAHCKWRQKKFREQVEYALKAVEIDNELYSAYNVLGIGYSHLRNSQKSIENYEVCINAKPDEYDYYRNRALSYLELEEDPSQSIPQKLRDQFAAKAKKDLNRVIELTNEVENRKSPYGLYYCRGTARLYLGQTAAAKQDLLKAKELFQKAGKGKRDVHEGKEISAALKAIARG